MSDFNIRLTMRDGTNEKTVEIDCGAARATELACISAIAGELQSTTAARLEWNYDLCDEKDVDKATADKAIAELGNGWRWPTLAEQETSRDITRFNPACDPALHPRLESAAYWTNDVYAPYRDYFWVVGFYNGYSFELHRDNKARVRAVRSVPAGQ